MAIGIGEGGEFCRPLVVPTFYDSIEITRDRMIAKFHARAVRRNAFVAFVLTFIEALLALLLLRWGYRVLKTALRLGKRRMGEKRSY